MKVRFVVVLLAMIGTISHAAAAQPKKRRIQLVAPAAESIPQAAEVQSTTVLSDLVALKPAMPLGPQDLLKSYQIAMNMLSDKTSNDFLMIVQAQRANQITREQAEYLLQQRYEIAMMQYQVLSALHEVLQHDIDEAARQSRETLKAANADDVVVVPFPGSTSGGK